MDVLLVSAVCVVPVTAVRGKRAMLDVSNKRFAGFEFITQRIFFRLSPDRFEFKARNANPQINEYENFIRFDSVRWISYSAV